MRRAKLDHVLEFGQSCIDDRVQLIKALDLTGIVGNCLSCRLKQFWNVSLRASITVEITLLPRQQITAFPRLGFKNASLHSRNSANHFVGVFDPAKAVSLPSEIGGQCKCSNDKQSQGDG